MSSIFVIKFYKRPAEILDYQMDWQRWLLDDTITESVWSVPALALADLTIDDSSFTNTTTTVWLKFGQQKTSYQVTNLITTAAGRKKEVLVQFELWQDV